MFGIRRYSVITKDFGVSSLGFKIMKYCKQCVSENINYKALRNISSTRRKLLTSSQKKPQWHETVTTAHGILCSVLLSGPFAATGR